MTTRTVVLNEAEQRIVKWIARCRQQANRTAHVADAKVGPQSNAITDLVGFGAEVAFGKLFNVYPDFDIRPRRGSADCERFGAAVDVKATVYPNGKLLAVLRKRELAADCYALMVADWPRFRFAGFVRAADLLVPERLTDLGHGLTYAIAQDDDVVTADQIPWRT